MNEQEWVSCLSRIIEAHGEMTGYDSEEATYDYFDPLNAAEAVVRFLVQENVLEFPSPGGQGVCPICEGSGHDPVFELRPVKREVVRVRIVDRKESHG